MRKITDEMIEVSYEYGKMYANGEIDLQDGIKIIVEKTGMNKGSARNAMQNTKCLLNEEYYLYNEC
jgi:hypothetical protein